jgi:hypothetical protein
MGRRHKVVNWREAIARNVIGIQAVALSIAADRLASNSYPVDAENWLALIMAQTKIRYESMTETEIQECIDRVTRAMYPKGNER